MTAIVPFAEYRTWPGISWSDLSNMAVSPLEFHERLHNPTEPTAAMDLGSAIHCAVLEPEQFDATYTYYDGAHNGYEWEAVKAGAAEAGMTVLSVKEWEQCLGAAEAFWTKPQGREARKLMRGARREVSYRWTDPVTHVRCKARPDVVRFSRMGRGGRIIPWKLADLKTTSSVDERTFGRLAASMLYHGKMALAYMGLETIYGIAPLETSIIAVEQKPPHDVQVYTLDEEVMEAGAFLAGRLLDQLKNCRLNRTYPGRYGGRRRLDFPVYALPVGDLFDGDIRFID